MARKKSLRIGEGARCSLLLKLLRPSQTIDEHFPNKLPTQRLDDLIAVRRGQASRGGKTYDAVWFTSDTFPGVTLHASRKFTKVTAEGPEDRIWDERSTNSTAAAAAVGEEGDDRGAPIDESVFGAGNRAEDIALVRNQGLAVDDDNDPAPENVPLPNAPAPNGSVLYDDQTWEWDGIDRMTSAYPDKPDASFKKGWSPRDKSYMEIFLHCLPMKWMEDVLLVATSAAMVVGGSAPLRWGEMIRYIGLWLLMSTCQGWTREDFWSQRPFDEQDDPCPYRLGAYMSRARFDAITKHLTFTNVNPPSYRDRFWEVRQMIKAWNDNMAAIFLASWALCLDESMSIWHNRWTCPGWVFCPRKPHPLGNEYHTACCALSGIMFVIELVEGKDHPRQLEMMYDNLGKTVGLMLRCLQSYFASGRYVILDSGFCVLKGIIELRKRGIFAGALVKKRRYWPTLVPGEAIKEHMNMDGVNVGDTAAIEGTLDEVKYNLWCMKEPDYTMTIMATGGRLLSDESCKSTVRRWLEDGVETVKNFAYALPFDWHFRYRHAVDDHNNLRHALPSIEDTWRTIRWVLRVFSFVLAISEVNAFLIVNRKVLCSPR